MNIFQNSDRILILGGTGFIGRHLTEGCLRDTSHVAVLGLSSKHRESYLKNVEILQADINNYENLWAALHKKSFDYIFNLSGYIDHTPYFRGGPKVIESHLISPIHFL